METAILGIVGAFLSILISAGTAIYNNRQTRSREEEARNENFEYNELAAQNADQRTRALYSDLESPQAQMQQIKTAGLSPSLFYSKNGAGGGISATGAMGQGVAGISPNVAMMGTPRDLAEINLMNAQADKAEAEADRTRGKGKMGDADYQKIVAETMGKEAEKALVQIETAEKEIDVKLKEATFEDNVNYVHWKSENMKNSATKLMYEAISANALAEIDQQTIMPRVQQEFRKNELLQADILFRQSTIKLNQAEIDRIRNEVEMWREEMLQEWTKLNIDRQNANTNKENAITARENALSYREYVESVSKFQDAQAENLKARLKMDEDHFTRQQRLEYTKIIATLVDNGLARGSDILVKLVPMATKGK